MNDSGFLGPLPQNKATYVSTVRRTMELFPEAREVQIGLSAS